MGRKSDTPPPIVVPDCNRGHEWACTEVYGTVDFAWCGDFREDHLVVANPFNDGMRPMMMPACLNRDSTGVHAHNWCYRCPAGLIGVRRDHRDSGRGRDGLHIAY
jgi:hypothetical protein